MCAAADEARNWYWLRNTARGMSGQLPAMPRVGATWPIGDPAPEHSFPRLRERGAGVLQYNAHQPGITLWQRQKVHMREQGALVPGQPWPAYYCIQGPAGCLASTMLRLKTHPNSRCNVMACMTPAVQAQQSCWAGIRQSPHTLHWRSVLAPGLPAHPTWTGLPTQAGTQAT